jgi:hypothetical protein
VTGLGLLVRKHPRSLSLLFRKPAVAPWRAPLSFASRLSLLLPAALMDNVLRWFRLVNSKFPTRCSSKGSGKSPALVCQAPYSPVPYSCSLYASPLGRHGAATVGCLLPPRRTACLPPVYPSSWQCQSAVLLFSTANKELQRDGRVLSTRPLLGPCSPPAEMKASIIAAQARPVPKLLAPPVLSVNSRTRLGKVSLRPAPGGVGH